MKLIGFKRNDFTTREGVTITGYNLYLTYPATGRRPRAWWPSTST